MTSSEPSLVRTWRVNSENLEVRFAPEDRLVDVLRDRLELKAAKIGCGEGECGACSVLINGELRLACLTLAAALPDHTSIFTGEGIAALPGGERLHQAFMDQGAVQCGFCTPGMLVAAFWVLQKPEVDIREGLSGNLCRCTGYQNIVNAVEACRAEGTGGTPP